MENKEQLFLSQINSSLGDNTTCSCLIYILGLERKYRIISGSSYIGTLKTKLPKICYWQEGDFSKFQWEDSLLLNVNEASVCVLLRANKGHIIFSTSRPGKGLRRSLEKELSVYEREKMDETIILYQ